MAGFRVDEPRKLREIQLNRSMKHTLRATILLLILAAGAAVAQNSYPTLLFDFDGADLSMQWDVLGDARSGGSSDSKVFTTGEGTLRFVGSIATAGEGGFAAARLSGIDLDLSGYDGLELRVRGDGRRYGLNLVSTATPHAPGRHADFATVAGEWIVVRVGFGEFTPVSSSDRVFKTPRLDLHSVLALGLLVADGRDGRFDVEVDWIRPFKRAAR